MTTQAPLVTVWFDGGCPLCRSEIALYQRLDAGKGRVAFVDLTAPDSAGSCPLDPAELLQRFHARTHQGDLVSGAAAFAALWAVVTPFQPLAWLMRIPGALAVGEWLYVRFLRIRPRLQRRLAS